MNMLDRNRPPDKPAVNRELKRNLKREQVVILTDQHIIEGNLYHHQEMRLSDALNAPANKESPYLALVDVTVHSVDAGTEVLCSQFLLVARSKIVVIMPKSEVLSTSTRGQTSE